MKRLLFVLSILFCASIVSAQIPENKLKVVVSKKDGRLVGRYVRETKTTLIANPVDWEEEVPKSSYKVEIWTPEKGKGFIGRKDGVKGNINVRKAPSVQSAVIAKITEEDSNKSYPDCVFDCLGKTNGWFKIKIKGKVGYVRQDLVEWAAYFAD